MKVISRNLENVSGGAPGWGGAFGGAVNGALGGYAASGGSAVGAACGAAAGAAVGALGGTQGGQATFGAAAGVACGKEFSGGGIGFGGGRNATVWIQAVDPRFGGQSERVGVVEVGEMEIVGN